MNETIYESKVTSFILSYTNVLQRVGWGIYTYINAVKLDPKS